MPGSLGQQGWWVWWLLSQTVIVLAIWVVLALLGARDRRRGDAGRMRWSASHERLLGRPWRGVWHRLICTSGGTCGEPEARRTLAAEWLDRLTFKDLREPDGYTSTILSVVGTSSRRHTSGGGWAMHEDMVYDGWAD
jgi:hypothetical protein